MKYLILYLLAFCMSFSLLGDDNKAASKRALFIASYHPAFATFNLQVEGLKSKLEPHNVALDVEFMDSKRLSDEINIQNFENSIIHKIEKLGQYDIIFTADDNALDFVSKNHDRIFTSVSGF